MEPIIGVSFAHFLPYGSGQLNGGNRLVGSFGSATLDGASDYYSQLIYKVRLYSGFPLCGEKQFMTFITASWVEFLLLMKAEANSFLLLD